MLTHPLASCPAGVLYIPYREILEGAHFRINGRKAFRINVRIIIFVFAHTRMPHPLV